MPDEDERSVGATTSERVLERVVLAVISLLTLAALVLNDFIADWIPGSWLAVGLTIGVVALIVALVSIPPSRLRRALSRTKPGAMLESGQTNRSAPTLDGDDDCHNARPPQAR